MDFTVSERVLHELGDWKYYRVTAQTENYYHDDDEQWQRRPKVVATITFNCDLAEGETMPLGTKLRLTPIQGE